MGKKILRVYLAKNDTPYSAAYQPMQTPVQKHFEMDMQ